MNTDDMDDLDYEPILNMIEDTRTTVPMIDKYPTEENMDLEHVLK